MKKWKKIILIFLVLISVLITVNMYLKNKTLNRENKSASSENVVLNEKTEEEILVNSNIDTDTNSTNNQIEENESNMISENIVQDEVKTIVIDPGHQAKGDSSKEPIGPGATETKAKVTTGATGISTKQKESELVLEVALLLEKALNQEGYNVIMTRTTNNVNISNQERATIANNANADAFIRIHADSYDNSSVNRNINIMPNTK